MELILIVSVVVLAFALLQCVGGQITHATVHLDA